AGPSGIIAAKTFLHNAREGAFRVTLYESKNDVGGLWPTSKTDSERMIHPLMVTNQSRYTMHFSDLAWEDDAPQMPTAWMVGQYLHRYTKRYLSSHPRFHLHLGTRVLSAAPSPDGWEVAVETGDGVRLHCFDRVIVASGFFGDPVVPGCLDKPMGDIPVVHSSAYRDLEGLLGSGEPGGGKILVVGGQMSGVEVANTIACHLSSAVNSPDASGIRDVDKYRVEHIVQDPAWVFPYLTSPEPTKKDPHFLPIDFSSYNLNNRPQPLVNSQGHISESASYRAHSVLEGMLGIDQTSIAGLTGGARDMARSRPPYVAVSDTYCDFTRQGLIVHSRGKLEAFHGTSASVVCEGVEKEVQNVAAIVVAAGFDGSSGLDILSQAVLDKLSYSPRHPNQPVALAFHGTHHPEVPGLGFVGYYRAPYWGVMQMQARFLSRYWSPPQTRPDHPTSSKLTEKLALDDSISRTLDLRDDPRCSQFPMGDFVFIVQDIADALELPMETSLPEGLPPLADNGKPIDMVVPARYADETDSLEARNETHKTLEATKQAILTGLTTPRSVARAVFRSLLGTWRLRRELKSQLPTHPSGTFTGEARFLLRQRTEDGLRCTGDAPPARPLGSTSPDQLEYLYIEEGKFTSSNGFTFSASRRYVWRYDEATDKMSVWFVKDGDNKRTDYLFHEIEFMPGAGAEGWPAKADHLCIDDYYEVNYSFIFEAVNVATWTAGYRVNGPNKNYSIRGTYDRCSAPAVDG
ncbi:Pyridine nucleotide-disulfide oxidoreductase, partial [Geosmithia morbida]